jgi:hypothetical protein
MARNAAFPNLPNLPAMRPETTSPVWRADGVQTGTIRHG